MSSTFDDPLSGFLKEDQPPSDSSYYSSSSSHSNTTATTATTATTISGSRSGGNLSTPLTIAGVRSGSPSVAPVVLTNPTSSTQPALYSNNNSYSSVSSSASNQSVLVVEATRSQSSISAPYYNNSTSPNNAGSSPLESDDPSGFAKQKPGLSDKPFNAQAQLPPPPPMAMLPPRPSAEYIVNTMTANFLSKCSKKPLELSAMSETEHCVLQLASANAWKLALQFLNNMCSIEDTLKSTPAGQIPVILKTKLECYYWLQLFDELSNDATLIIEREKGLCEDGSSSPGSLCNKTLSTVSISLLILLEEVKALTGRGKEAMEQLFRYKREFEESQGNINNSKFWIWRIRQVVINIAVRRRYWRLALSMTVEMIDDLMKWGEHFKENEAMGRSISILKLTALCRLSRFYLQASNLSSSIKVFKFAKTEYSKLRGASVNVSEADLNSHWDRYFALTTALLEFADNKYDSAFALLSRVISFEVASQKASGSNSGGDVTIVHDLNNRQTSGSTLEADILAIEQLFCCDGSLLSIATNNYAICALYLKRMSEAVSRLEQLIFDDPAANLKDPIVFNLCTLYDLSCTPELSLNKKKVLHAVSLAYHINDPIINWKNFRLNNQNS